MAGYLGVDVSDEKPYIFISYNTEDANRLSMIVKYIHQQQINVWYDNGIQKISEEEWQEQIANHIRAAEIVFFFISKGVFAKSDSFVKKEYDLAVRHNKNICVVLMDDIDTTVIPAKYDFWWGEIINRQCICVKEFTDKDVAGLILNECYNIESFKMINSSRNNCYRLKENGKFVANLSEGSYIVGSSERKSDILIINNKSVSGLHAVLRISKNRVFVRDLNTTNGTYVNGIRILPMEEIEIKSGDEIRFSSSIYVLE